MSKLYTIKEETLTNITDAIRRKFNFDEKIKVTNIPLYISNDSSLFWVTHFNDNSGDLEGTGVIYTSDFGTEIARRGWHYYVTFSPLENTANYYTVRGIVDYGVSHNVMIKIDGLNLNNFTVNPNATLTCQVPTKQDKGQGVVEVVYTNTTYPIYSTNVPNSTDHLTLFSSVSNWASMNPAWSCAVLLRPTVSAGLYNVVKNIDYPIQTVRENKGYDKNSDLYTPTVADYTELLQPYFQTGDIIACGNNQSIYQVLFHSEETPVDLKIDLTAPEDGFVYAINFGNDYPSHGINRPNYSNPGAASMWNFIQSWHVGDNVMIENVNLKEKRIPTTTPTLLWYEDGYTCTSKCDLIKSNTITIDGNLLDYGWGQDGWYLVNKFNGTFQAGEPTNTVFANSQYMYKFRTDNKYLYVGMVRIFDNLSSSADIERTHNLRLWINPDKENAQIYSHFYDLQIDLSSNALTTQAKHNTSSTSNVPENITNTSLDAKASIDQHKVVFEFKIELTEFGGENGFAYFLDYAYDGTGNGFTLYAQDIAKSAANDYSNFPYNSWYKEGQGIVDLEEEEISSDEAISLIKEALL